MSKMFFYLFFILFLVLLPTKVFSNKTTVTGENSSGEIAETEETTQKAGHSIKEYSSGTIYKSANTTTQQRANNATNDGDPGFPGDPGQGLPVGDGYLILTGAAIFYFMYKKFNLRKNHETKSDSI